MNGIVTAAELIELSVREDRTAMAYPSTREEYDALLDDLLASSEGDVDTAEVSGDGAEDLGYTEVWSQDGWRVDLIHPE